ncbi:ATP-dependent protease La [Radiomyces spectabilis]|uniref:ATP-dependent protease La n=1 Tax=Radiomyces spectabilis TaxID=64574 RepID=UPI00221F9CDD|nr:ATP-dependent protease La [Radiomyces spectabilis]KAI8379380.1 ATP-dependent protease La [Radiomyces spectabilis]
MQAIGVPEAMLNQFSALIDRCPFSSLANLLLCVTESSFHEKLHVLEITDFRQRLHGINQMITRHLQQHIGEKLDRKRREFCLRQQSNPASTHCVTEDFKMDDSMDHNDDEFGELVNQLKRARLPAHARSAIHRDVNRLRKLPPSSAESSVLRIYLEWVADLPWKKATSDIVDLRAAEKQLDHDHFGLGHVKRRILEYLSVVKVKQDLSPPILCFVGPPGVGKTTLGISIATALQRKFHRIALGGIRDEAEIRGHRRTYVGALPGVLIQSLKKCGVNNPLILLDEIDKIVQGTHQGDPAAALLEVLDPAQNSSFTDHFLHIPFDLSQVMFIATANSIESIPEALLDRMEVIDLHGYTFEEKLVIAKSHLVPNQLSAHGLNHAGLHISDEVLLHLVEHYTRESGVRQLDRRIASVCRYKCREYANLAEENMLSTFDTNVNLDDIEKILGLAPFENEIMDMEAIPGLVNGLAYSRSGIGSVLQVETNQMPGQGDLKLTGSLGEVIRESALIAISWVRANAYALHLTNCSTDVLFKETDIHIHLPNGAVPKDGPSAGVTLVTSIISLLSGKPVPRLTAMTGEITLRGQVRPVGGIKEKVLSAHRAGITKIILPILNRKEVMQDVPKTIRNDIHFVFCKHIWEVVQAAFDPYDQAALGWEPQHSSRL